jgi:hypothetical protein
VGISLPVAGYQIGIVEVVAGIHDDILRESPPHLDLAFRRQQRDLDAVDLRPVLADDSERSCHARSHVVRPPITGERRIEHLAQPVKNGRLSQLAEHLAVDFEVVLRTPCRPRQRPARHEYHLAAGLLDRFALHEIGFCDGVERQATGVRQMIGAGAAGDDGASPRLGGARRALHQLQRVRPVEPHAALGGVHGFGNAESHFPEIIAEGQRALPVDGGPERGIDIGERIDDHMGGREGLAVPGRRLHRHATRLAGKLVWLDAAVRRRQIQARHFGTSHM